jgi:hypothetical protein
MLSLVEGMPGGYVEEIEPGRDGTTMRRVRASEPGYLEAGVLTMTTSEPVVVRGAG